MRRRPDFLIIGAMKCGTSTLHVQLGLQKGIFTCDPKEPGYFSHDDVYARGGAWYAELFAPAEPGDLCGESSTHYTKLPTHPACVERIRCDLGTAKFVYLMRDPIERLVSHYIHEWTERMIASASLEEALGRYDALTAYSRYAMQLEPYLEAFGRDAVLPVFLERLRADPQGELERICRFLGYEGTPHWHEQDQQRNASSERLRRSAVRDVLLNAPVLKPLRQRLVPASLRDRVKKWWQMRERPVLGPGSRQRLESVFDADLARLGAWLGTDLRCRDFAETVTGEPLEWTAAAPDRTQVP